MVPFKFYRGVNIEAAKYDKVTIRFGAACGAKFDQECGLKQVFFRWTTNSDKRPYRVAGPYSGSVTLVEGGKKD